MNDFNFGDVNTKICSATNCFIDLNDISISENSSDYWIS